MPSSRSWLAATLLVLLAAAPLGAQEAVTVDRVVPRFEWGLYGGLAPTSDWLGINEEYIGLVSGVESNDLSGGFDIGLPPIFGTTLSWYFTPLLGVRLHGALMPSEFPTRDSDAVEAFGALGPAVLEINALAEDASDYPLNNWFLDLDLVVRPWTKSTRAWLASTYLFAGGGVLISDVAGDSDPGDLFTDEAPDPVDAFEPIGATLPYERRGATVGQGTVGLGLNVFPFGRIGLFGELATHGYTAPIETPAKDDPAFELSLVEARTAWTFRAVLGLKMAFGDLTPPVALPAAPLDAPPPVPTPRPLPEVPPPPVVREEPVRVCVVEDGALREVDALYRTASGDTVVLRDGVRVPLREAFPAAEAPYAAAQPWVQNAEPFTFDRREYVRFGVPRVIPPTQLTRVGEYREIPLFAETGATAPHPVLYLPLEPGCRFQPYQLREELRVRG